MPEAPDQLITLQEATALTTRFRSQRPSPTVLGWGFSRPAIDAVLSTAGCAGIRVYRALSEKGEEQVVIVAIDANGKDLVSGAIAERGWPCPPICGDSVLSG